MESQTNSLSDEASTKTLNGAFDKARSKYNGTLANTSKAIEKLRYLRGDAVEVVKILEVAAALNSFNDINDQMKSFEGRVDGIMQESNLAIVESKNFLKKEYGIGGRIKCNIKHNNLGISHYQIPKLFFP